MKKYKKRNDNYLRYIYYIYIFESEEGEMTGNFIKDILMSGENREFEMLDLEE